MSSTFKYYFHKRRIKIRELAIVLLVITYTSIRCLGQTAPPAKQVQSATQAWYSINTVTRFSDYWGVVADFHIRTTDFMAENYFYFLRAGGVYWIQKKQPVIFGVAHLWLAPAAGNSTWSDENRIYEEWSTSQSLGKANIFHRIRVEERWKDYIVNDQKTGDKLFSVRLRYLASFGFNVFKNEKLPSVVLSDEILVQFGKDVVYNTFDQNRLFMGLKFPLSSRMSCDIGYMNIFQQNANGYQYTNSNIFRWFFYYYLDRRDLSTKSIHSENSE